MQATTFETLRELVLHHGAARGWRTQRHIAVACGLDESALSRFLNGEQDIGARRTHALFQAIGIPVEHYDLAYALLGRAQELAAESREARSERTARARGTLPRVAGGPWRGLERPAPHPVAIEPWPAEDLPAAVVVALFAAEGYSGGQIAAFFAR